MKISEFVHHLTVFMSQHGDLDVYMLVEDSLKVPELTHSFIDWRDNGSGSWEDRGLKEKSLILDGSLERFMDPLENYQMGFGTID